MRYELSNQEWSIIRAMLPTKPRGIPRVDERRVLNGIFWVLRSGAPWRDLPPIYGPRTTCYNRFVRWRRAGIWDSILQALTRGLPPQTMVLADRGYDADWIRAFVNEQGAWANIPPKRNRRQPKCFSPHLYRARNRIERFFNKIKHCRRIATRYDKLAANYPPVGSLPRSPACGRSSRKASHRRLGVGVAMSRAVPTM
jgi:transposase